LIEAEMNYFLVIYDRASGKVRLRDFGSAREDALKARFEAEESGLDEETEVVVLSASSREDLERTHSRYFHSMSELARAGAKKQVLSRESSIV
jgi:hypothetical protein